MEDQLTLNLFEEEDKKETFSKVLTTAVTMIDSYEEFLNTIKGVEIGEDLAKKILNYRAKNTLYITIILEQLKSEVSTEIEKLALNSVITRFNNLTAIDQENFKKAVDKEVLAKLNSKDRDNSSKAWDSTEDVINAYKEVYSNIEQPIEEVLKIEGDFFTKEQKQEIENTLQISRDSGLAFYDNNPLTRNLIRPKEQEKERQVISLNNKEGLEMYLDKGFITERQASILNAIGKYFYLEEQKLEGKVFVTIHQLFRALKGNPKTRGNAKQLDSLMKELEEMEDTARKIEVSYSEEVGKELAKQSEELLGVKMDKLKESKLRLISFDSHKYEYMGQEGTLIVFDKTPLMLSVAKTYGMALAYEQEQLNIKDKNGKPIPITNKRNTIRDVLLRFILSYKDSKKKGIRTAYKLPLSKIYESCNINTKSRETLKRTNDFIEECLNYWVSTKFIDSWSYYYNKSAMNLKKSTPSGIQITCNKEEGLS